MKLADWYSDSGNPIPEDVELLIQDLLWIRLCELKGSDWTQLPDAPLDEAWKEEWRIYRQALRDLPENLPDTHGEILEVVFPEKPE